MATLLENEPLEQSGHIQKCSDSSPVQRFVTYPPGLENVQDFMGAWQVEAHAPGQGLRLTFRCMWVREGQRTWKPQSLGFGVKDYGNFFGLCGA